MIGPAFALLSAAGYGGAQLFIQIGLREGQVSVMKGMVINLATSSAALGLALLAVLMRGGLILKWEGVGFFVAAGLLSPLAGRGLNFLAIERVGATRGASLLLSESLFSGPLAFFLLGQKVTATTIAGIVVIVAGMALFINEAQRTLAGPGPVGLDVPQGNLPRHRVLAGVAFGLLSGVLFAVAQVFRQLGVDAIPSAVLGSFIGSVAALLVTTAGVVRAGRLRACLEVRREALIPLALSGLLGSVGMLAFFWALDFGSSVAIASALKNTSAVFTFVLAVAFLRKRERLTFRMGVLVVLVAGGAAMTALGRR